MSRKLVYVDTESTGLDPATCVLTELAYAVEDGPVKTLYFGVTEVPDFINDLTRFYERGIHKMPMSSVEDFNEFRQASAGNTMVASNPSHDKGFLQKYNLFNFHYRMLDISSWAAGRLNLSEMPGMDGIFKELSARGYDVPKGDHSAEGDVVAMRAAHLLMRDQW